MRRPIAISLSPNTEKEDVFEAAKLLFSPWKFFQKEKVQLLEQWFRQFFSVSDAVSFASGRGALLAILKALNIGEKDEVIVQAFTCVAVPNSIIAVGAKPVFADVDVSLTVNLKDLEKKITKKTKAVIVQHTFGIPADIAKIKEIAKKHKIFVIEDCAHVIGGLRTCDAAFFSFGRDKAFSSVFGGIAITNNKELGSKLRSFQKQLPNPTFGWVLQQLFHPIAFYLMILPLYNFFSFGKIILVILQRTRVLSLPVDKGEKEGKISKTLIKKLPNALACLALLQLRRVKEFNQKREKIAKIYLKNLNKKYYKMICEVALPFLRFPVLTTSNVVLTKSDLVLTTSDVVTNRRDEIIEFLKRQGIYLGKWYSEIIDPKGVDLKKIFYQKGSCPKAEYMAKRIINLPTYPTMKVKEAKIIVNLLNNYAEDRRN